MYSWNLEAEQNPLCRKLQLKDMIPVEMQRLVKYAPHEGMVFAYST